MTSKSYVKTIIIASCSLLTFISVINVTVDPGSIYLRPALTQLRVQPYIDLLLKSEFGVIQTGWNERQVKLTLAQHAGRFDCVVIGSSHIMNISKTRDLDNTTSHCESLLNLGVSGASLEDALIFLYVLANGPLPQKIFIGIDPWLFNFDKDSRWGAYSDLYDRSHDLFGINTISTEKESQSLALSLKYQKKLLSNLINGEYFSESWQALDETLNEFKQLLGGFNSSDYEVPQFDFSAGFTQTVTLPDGSHAYSQDYIRSNHNLNDTGYKINNTDLVNPEAITKLSKAINFFLLQGVTIDLLVTPYHHNVLADANSESKLAFKQVSSPIKQLAAQLNIDTYGSYNPSKIGCTDDQFYDFMHPTTECVNKIFEKKNIALY